MILRLKTKQLKVEGLFMIWRDLWKQDVEKAEGEPRELASQNVRKSFKKEGKINCVKCF